MTIFAVGRLAVFSVLFSEVPGVVVVVSKLTIPEHHLFPGMRCPVHHYSFVVLRLYAQPFSYAINYRKTRI